MTGTAHEPGVTAAATAAATQAATAAASTAAATQAATEAATSAQSSAGVTAAGSAPASKAGVPEKYDLKLAADAKVDQAIVSRTESAARAQGLNNEQGQRLLDAVVAEVAAQDAARVDAWKPGGTEWMKRDEEWSKQALADPELGNGDKAKLDNAIELAQKVRTALGGKDFDEFLKTTGLGSHPAALKFLAKIGRSMSESSLIPGRPVGSSASGKSAAERMYGPEGTGKPKPE